MLINMVKLIRGMVLGYTLFNLKKNFLHRMYILKLYSTYVRKYLQYFVLTKKCEG